VTRESAERLAWLIGCTGCLLALLGWLMDPAVFPYAWLTALSAWVGWPLGCLALLLAHALTGGRWGIAIRPHLLIGIGTLPLLLPAIVPLLFVLPRLYPWLRSDGAGTIANAFYLNGSFAVWRGIAYLIVWFGLAGFALRAARRGPIPGPLAVTGLILLAITVTFAAVDATMSLDPHFASSSYGMIAGAESGLLAASVCVLAAALDPRVPADTLNDVGRLLLGLLVLWAYLDFMQLLIVWNSNLPNEAAWYVARASHGWASVAAIIAIGHFLLPFFALLAPRLRQTRQGLVAVATLLIVMEALRAWWLVLPADHRFIGWIDVAAMLAIAGFAAGMALHGSRPAAMSLRTSHG
jgi:hypothetical protein